LGMNRAAQVPPQCHMSAAPPTAHTQDGEAIEASKKPPRPCGGKSRGPVYLDLREAG
jgi:hypothetical protein